MYISFYPLYIKTKWLLIFILLLPLLGKAQPYQSIFGQESTEWYIASRNLGMEKFMGTDTARVIKIFQYEGYTWHKVHFPKHFNLLDLREVLDSGRVYGRLANYDTVNLDENEYLLFDMSLNQGDTFKFLLDYEFIDIPVDTVYYENGRKIIDFYWPIGFDSVQTALKFIEGIGPSNSLDELMTHDGYPSNTTLCSYKDGQMVYNSGLLGGRCTLEWVGIEEMLHQEFKVWPNPVDDFLQLEIPEGKNVNARIFDVTGKVVFQLINPKNEINVTKLIPGMYFIKTDRHLFSRFIKL